MADVKPNLTEKLANRVAAMLLRLGLAPADLYMLEVPGRKSGRILRTPVDLMHWQGRDYLVAPRGATQWVRNVRTAGLVTLRRGSRSGRYAVAELPDAAKAPLLREYLGRYTKAVQRHFAVTPESSLAAFAAVAANYPVFEVTPVA